MTSWRARFEAERRIFGYHDVGHLTIVSIEVIRSVVVGDGARRTNRSNGGQRWK